MNNGEKKQPPSSEQPKCPFETKAITCNNCGGVVNVAPAGPGQTEVHCDECGVYYISDSTKGK